MKENVSGAHIPSEPGMKGTPWGEGQLGTVGSSETQQPHAGSNCYENPGSRSEASYLHGKLSLF